MDLSIIIPIFNERKTLPELLEKINAVQLSHQQTGKELSVEILLIDDGSTDGTREFLQWLEEKIEKNKIKKYRIFYHDENKGKGAALRTGFTHATGGIIITQDADLEYEPKDYEPLLKPISNGDADVVYGTRFYSPKGHLKERQHFTYIFHYIGNASLTLLTNLLFFTSITDMETGYKVFTKKVLAALPPLKADSFDIEPELTAKILKKGFKIKEVPIHYYSRSFSEGKKITWRDGLYAAWVLLKYRFVD